MVMWGAGHSYKFKIEFAQDMIKVTECWAVDAVHMDFDKGIWQGPSWWAEN